VPDSETVCGLVAALSAMDSVSTRFPLEVGVNLTLIVQFRMLQASRAAGILSRLLGTDIPHQYIKSVVIYTPASATVVQRFGRTNAVSD
jgi:hypothetical protein